MTQALNLANFANNLNTSGQASNSGLQNSSIGVVAGTGIGVSNSSPALGGTTTISNTGVTAITAGTGISVSGSTGNVTINSTSTGLPGVLGQVFTSSGTFTVPSGVTAVKVTVVGGGGGSPGLNGCSGTVYQNGSAGGSSSIASGTQTISTVTAGGGGGGTQSVPGTGGTPSGGTTNIYGNDAPSGGYGGTSTLGSAYYGSRNAVSSNASPARNYGNGGGINQVGNGGGAGATCISYLTGLTSGNTISVTVGAGGSYGNGIYGGFGGNSGSAGIVIFEW